MDALRPIEIATAAPAPTIAPAPAMPPEKPLVMPVQSLSRWSRAEERAPARVRPVSRALARTALRLRRGGGADRLRRLRDVPGRVGQPHDRAAVAPARPVHRQLLLDRARLHERAPRLRRRSCAGPRRLPPLPETLRSRTAVVMPVYNESTARTFAALEAIREEIEATGLGEHFDYFVLSDSTDPDAWIAEERAFLAWRQRARRRMPASTTATGRRTITARPATSPISSRAGAAPTSTCWCSTPTA